MGDASSWWLVVDACYPALSVCTERRATRQYKRHLPSVMMHTPGEWFEQMVRAFPGTV